MSQLTIASDKTRGILGKADLDLAQFSYDDFKVMRLDIEECQYEGAWAEVGLKAVPSLRKSNSNRMDTSLNLSQRSSTTVGSTSAS